MSFCWVKMYNSDPSLAKFQPEKHFLLCYPRITNCLYSGYFYWISHTFLYVKASLCHLTICKIWLIFFQISNLNPYIYSPKYLFEVRFSLSSPVFDSKFYGNEKIYILRSIYISKRTPVTTLSHNFSFFLTITFDPTIIPLLLPCRTFWKLKLLYSECSRSHFPYTLFPKKSAELFQKYCWRTSFFGHPVLNNSLIEIAGWKLFIIIDFSF